MDKNELIEKIAGNTGLTKKDVGIVINTFIVTVTKALVEGSKVQLLGFGVFGTRERNARKVRNPRTGESIDLAASTVPYFKPGKPNCLRASNKIMFAELARLKERSRVSALIGIRIAVS